LFETYEAVVRDGWPLTTDHIQRDVERMFQGNFRQWTGLPSAPPITPSAGVLA
jgi:hypothetical protein